MVAVPLRNGMTLLSVRNVTLRHALAFQPQVGSHLRFRIRLGDPTKLPSI